jgi:hypothetical protein
MESTCLGANASTKGDWQRCIFLVRHSSLVKYFLAS